MIEKFSDEELKQIMKELGVRETGVRAFSVVEKEVEELTVMQSQKPQILSNDCRGKLHESVRSIVAITMNNVVKTKKGYYKCSCGLAKEDEEEYRQMYREIIAIIKKHNRPWKGDTE